MLSEAILLAAIQIGPFFESRDDYAALRPLWSREGEVVDVAWPLFTSHRDWWRCCYLVSRQKHPEGGGQFSIMPFWFSGDHPEEGEYAGLFPLYGRHPHIALVYDLEFALWPLWMRYRMPRTDGDGARRMLTSNVFMFPFFSFRDDGSWGVWPFYGVSKNRESVQRYALWPVFNWAEYESDRDTSGAGSSGMIWPICGWVNRQRESQTLFLPPFFSMAMTEPVSRAADKDVDFARRYRLPWPFIEWESGVKRERVSIFPLYEKVKNRRYSDGKIESEETRIGWKLVEIMPNETRVFPFWASNADGYLRIWPFFERSPLSAGIFRSRFLALFPIRHVPGVERNWAKFWTFYEREDNKYYTDHSLLWGLIEWRTAND